MKQRKNEKIGGGFFVFRRNPETGRVAPGSLPHEHPTRDAAVTEATRLAMQNRGATFVVLGQHDVIKCAIDGPMIKWSNN